MGHRRGYAVAMSGTLTRPDLKIEGVRARVFFFADPTRAPRFTLHPSSREQFDGLTQFMTWRFEATRARSPVGPGAEHLVCEALHIRRGSARTTDRRTESYTIRCIPSDVVHHWSEGDPEITREWTIEFRLTPCRLLGPVSIHGLRPDGSVDVKKKQGLRIPISESVEVEFDTRYAWHSNRRTGSDSRSPFRVAVAQDWHTNSSAQTTARATLCKMDDLLLLVSFAIAYRVVATGWTASSEGQDFVRFERGDISRPGRTKERDFGPIRRGEFADYLKSSWSAFGRSSFQKPLRSAMHACVASESKTLQSAYMTMFAALEELTLAHRRVDGSEHLIDPKAWSKLRGQLDSIIVNQLNGEAPTTTERLLDAIARANRAPMRSSYERLLTRYGVDVSDLWPMFGRKESGLSNVRHRLVHGDFAEENAMHVLVVARDHLRWTLSRIIARMLDWPIERTRISHSFLLQMTAMTELSKARSAFSSANGL